MNKPKECPKCKSKYVKHILYGLPDSNEAPDGEYLGGCELRDEIWHCGDCRWEWGNRNKGTGVTFNEVPQKNGGHYAEPEDEDIENKQARNNAKSKIFWKNFLPFMAVVLAVPFLLSISENDSGGTYTSFSQGYLLVATLCVLALGYKVAMGYVKYEDLEELRVKKNMTGAEFREKYGEIMDIYGK